MSKSYFSQSFIIWELCVCGQQNKYFSAETDAVTASKIAPK